MHLLGACQKFTHFCLANEKKASATLPNTGAHKEVESIQEDLNQIKLHVSFSFLETLER